TQHYSPRSDFHIESASSPKCPSRRIPSSSSTAARPAARQPTSVPTTTAPAAPTTALGAPIKGSWHLRQFCFSSSSSSSSSLLHSRPAQTLVLIPPFWASRISQGQGKACACLSPAAGHHLPLSWTNPPQKISSASWSGTSALGATMQQCNPRRTDNILQSSSTSRARPLSFAHQPWHRPTCTCCGRTPMQAPGSVCGFCF
ncbi:hypothetical protein F5883DRAFT_151120, partial [Diaporthe sp. PMI_573]